MYEIVGKLLLENYVFSWHFNALKKLLTFSNLPEFNFKLCTHIILVFTALRSFQYVLQLIENDITIGHWIKGLVKCIMTWIYLSSLDYFAQNTHLDAVEGLATL